MNHTIFFNADSQESSWLNRLRDRRARMKRIYMLATRVIFCSSLRVVRSRRGVLFPDAGLCIQSSSIFSRRMYHQTFGYWANDSRRVR